MKACSDVKLAYAIGKIVTMFAGKQDKLTFDSAPTAGSSNPVTSDGVYKAILEHQTTTDSAPTSGSINPVSSGGVYDALDAKQNKLTFDSTPTSGSNNPVTSDGIYKALDNVQTKGDYAPAYTYGAEDLTAGTSPLDTGKLHFVYE